MKTRTNKILLSVLIAVMLLSGVAIGDPQKTDKKPGAPPAATKKPAAEKNKSLRDIRVAVFDFDVVKGVKIDKGVELDTGALTDQINTMLAALPKVTIVN
ncbi:MAG: hypothetical protein K8S55_13235, partial [Phycisphaerae bacterium]|nr:hypothetical protein [Phycisphaerae bacterium]